VVGSLLQQNHHGVSTSNPLTLGEDAAAKQSSGGIFSPGTSVNAGRSPFSFGQRQRFRRADCLDAANPRNEGPQLCQEALRALQGTASFFYRAIGFVGVAQSTLAEQFKIVHDWLTWSLFSGRSTKGWQAT
jgi:hypothetical protein